MTRLTYTTTIEVKDNGAYRWANVTLVASAYLKVTEVERVDNHEEPFLGFVNGKPVKGSRKITDETIALASVAAAAVARKRALRVLTALHESKED